MNRLRLRAVMCGMLLTCAVTARAGNLPVKTYTTTEGLAGDQVNRIVRDSRGFLWFCTSQGLSRFDGYKFINYTTDQGLPHRTVNDLLEASDGTYWIATNGGLSRFNPTGTPRPFNATQRPDIHNLAASQAGDSAPMFFVYRADSEVASRINDLYQDRAGIIWCATDKGLYRLQQNGADVSFVPVDIGVPASVVSPSVNVLLEDRYGWLWIGGNPGLYRRSNTSGRTERFTTKDGMPSDYISSLFEDDEGRIWAGTGSDDVHKDSSLCQFTVSADRDRPTLARTYTPRAALSRNELIITMLQTTDHRMWIGAGDALYQFLPDATDSKATFRAAYPLGITALAEDRDGNLWMGTESSGAKKLVRRGFTTFGLSDGLSSVRLSGIFTGADGELYVNNLSKHIDRFDGEKFTTVSPRLPARNVDMSSGWGQTTFQDHAGEWWLMTGEGLYRYPKVEDFAQLAHTAPKYVYTKRDGMPHSGVFSLYEDSRGDVWIGTLGPEQENPNTLARWKRATERIEAYTEAEGLPRANGPVCFREDRAGNIWMGYYAGGLARYRRSDGRFDWFTTRDNLPGGMIRALHLDRQGRLWIAATNGGVARVDDPAAERPQFLIYTTADGLSSNVATCFTEDEWGRIYIGTGRGLNQLDPATRRVRQYTTADGLSSNFVHVAHRDPRTGALWFGSLVGLSRFIPETELPAAPPPVFINGLRIAGVAQNLSALGETEIQRLDLDSTQRQIEIDFFGLGFASGETLRYQYKLEGTNADWSTPTDQRTVTLNLSPGAYRFLVRALSADGTTSEHPAVVSFNISRPIWQRPWFLLIAILASGSIGYAAYRYRVRQLVALERVRTRIATDLHDDIGASLSRMAILSEVVKHQQLVTSNGKAGGDDAIKASREQSVVMLTEIADSARGLLDSMSDIVWSIDPRRDDLRAVVQRVRQFASDVLEAKGIQWEFRTTLDLEHVKLGAEQRRHLYLIYKEAINNIARHAEGCTSVVLSIEVKGKEIIGEVQDDGCGFAGRNGEETRDERVGAGSRGGNGLPNMRRRAEQAGGQLEINSRPGAGTRLTLRVALK